MTEKDFKNYFSANFTGVQNLIDKVLSPMFGTFTGKKLTDRVDDMGNGNANIDHIYEYGSYRVGGTEVSVWEVVLSDNCRISQARKNIQSVVRQLIGTYSGAFVIFHYDANSTNADAGTWRFSWVKKEATQAGATSAKRYTYLCGPSYSCRTIAERFNVLQNTSNKTLDSITAAFDVEALSDEFFYNFRALYSKIQGEGEKDKSKYKRYKKLSDIPENELGFCDFIERHKDDSEYFDPQFNRWDGKVLRDYIKKLMGRLVFLQFLQKKGWMCGNSNYIKSLFEKFVQDNNEKVTDTNPGTFLDKVLEPLFFGVLNTKVADRQALFTKEKWDANLLKEWENIPYLNGGLFEQEEYDKPKSAFPNALFNELFELFSEYNFTIDENDPEDKEVGIDPEMLSKIFESQLEDNKDKGAFYTPKEIVEYMCKESLIAYLQTDITDESTKESIRNFVSDRDATLTGDLETTIAKKLKDVKICDPAIGSGAFPMGMMNLLVNTREKLDGEQNRAELKKEIICNNIYGVDIEKGAVDIARLRFWLSLIIEEEKPQALPNLDYKIMQGNSLLEQYEGIDLSGLSTYANTSTKKKQGQGNQLSMVFDEKIAMDNIQKAIKNIYRTESHKEKEELRNTINDNIKDYIFHLRGCTTEIQSKLNALSFPNDQFFLWHIYFKEVLDKGGFDVVIGNPPYGASLCDAEKQLFKKLYQSVKTIKGVQKGSLDTFSIFIEQGIRLLKPVGQLVYIVPMSITSSAAMQGIHRVLSDNCSTITVSSYSNRPVQIFKSAGLRVSILMGQKDTQPLKNLYTTKLIRRKQTDSLKDIIDRLSFVESSEFILPGKLPKVSFQIEKEILNKCRSHKCNLVDYEDNKLSPIYYRAAGGRYWNVVTPYPTHTSAEKPFYCRHTKLIGLILSSSVFWFYQQVYTDGLNLKRSDLNVFPLPDLDAISPEKYRELEKLYDDYLLDIEKQANTRNASESSSYNVSQFKEYKIVRSKDLVRKIDETIAPLYGLDATEIAYIINYEFEYRVAGQE